MVIVQRRLADSVFTLNALRSHEYHNTASFRTGVWSPQLTGSVPAFKILIH